LRQINVVQLLLVYKVPSEPSARRVYVWRKLKRLGAVLLHDAVWVLPANPRTQEHLQWLAAEIQEMGGDALLWEARELMFGQEQALIRQFQEQVDAEYRLILTALQQADADIPAPDDTSMPKHRLFRMALGQQVREALIETRGQDDVADLGKHRRGPDGLRLAGPAIYRHRRAVHVYPGGPDPAPG
jgi:hypothetical protein